MSVWGIVLWVAAALVGGLLLLASRKPNALEVKRSIRIGAPAAVVHGLIADFHKWTAWSPWEELDPSMQRQYGGASAGEGATYSWEGNKKVGRGRMEITHNQPPHRVEIHLHFMAPWEATNRTVFTVIEHDEGCEVCWLMNGESPFMMKVMSLFINLDAMVGKDFERGLSRLKTAAEKAD